ncbi:MAG TPA: hypothetical protein VKB37_06705 [Jatrophihabitantaceae bacterium]|nr:hypothetical protein [Jatrophihabitantaceae bacterium]
MSVLIGYAAILVPAAMVWAALKALRWWSESAATRRAPVAGHGPSLERLVDDLRRIEREYVRVERSDLPARAARLRALNLAYDDTLRACCHALQLPEPSERPLSGVARLRTEAELAQHGLEW